MIPKWFNVCRSDFGKAKAEILGSVTDAIPVYSDGTNWKVG